MRILLFDLPLIARKKTGGHLIRLEDISEQIFQTRVVLPPDFSAVCIRKQLAIHLPIGSCFTW